jgi:hypothetical protein
VNQLPDLSIPNDDLGIEPKHKLGLSPMPHPKRSPSDKSGADVFSPSSISSPAAGKSPQQPWSSGVQPRPDSFQSSPSPKGFPSSPAGSATSLVGDVSLLTLPEIQARKRDLKQQLKQYDMNFARKHGRMPVKAEKEPIRHLYETYNTLKSAITTIEQDGPVSPAAQQPMQQPRGMSIQRTPSPPLTATTAGSGPDSSGSEDHSPGPPMVRPKRGTAGKLKQPPLPDVPPSTPAAESPSQDLAALKTEKGKLHQMLRSYEKDFFKEHKRQVSSFADIKPVASQYRRYKEIKKAIATLQQHGGDST